MGPSRITTRRLMVLVALVAAVAAMVAGLRRRQQRFHGVAQQHALAEAKETLNSVKAALRRIDRGTFTKAESALLRAASRRKRAYHKAMSDKYRRAAARPWLPVPPDPPPPE